MKKAWGIAAGLMVAVLALSACGGGDGGGAAVLLPKTSVKLPQTGQVTSYDTNTTQRDDGALKMGVAWPNPRFTVTSSGTGTVVADNLTGLLWASDPTLSTPCSQGTTTTTWQGALDYVACLNANNYLSHSDWRLPNRKELRSLVNYGQANTAIGLNTQGFANVQAVYYWSSTTYAGNTSNAWSVDMGGGAVTADPKSGSDFPGVMVLTNAAAYAAPANQPKTGQTKCYDAAGAVISCATITGQGQDGALKTGIAWPNPRFTVASNVTGTVVKDNLTGLMWAGNAGTPTVGGCTGGPMTWQQALNYVACLNSDTVSGGYNDWRLPNVNELESLVHAGYNEVICAAPSTYCATNADWLNTQGFSNVWAYYYWSSTTYAGDTSYYAWLVYMADGDVDNGDGKAISYYVWPVRAGP